MLLYDLKWVQCPSRHIVKEYVFSVRSSVSTTLSLFFGSFNNELDQTPKPQTNHGSRTQNIKRSVGKKNLGERVHEAGERLKRKRDAQSTGDREKRQRTRKWTKRMRRWTTKRVKFFKT